MEIEELIDFLETDTLSFIFSPVGLKYLSLRAKPDLDHINLETVSKEQAQNPTEAGYLREKLLEWEGQDLSKLRGNYVCTRKKCCQE